MVLQQRLRTEVSQVKKETNFYLNNVEKGARMDKLKRKREREGQQVTLARQSLSVRTDKILVMLCCVPNRVSLPPPGGGQDVGLHSASDGGGDPSEEEEETTGQGPPHTGEEPIKCLPAGQDFQHRQVRLTLDWLWGRLRRPPSVTKEAELNTAVETVLSHGSCEL